MREVGFVAVLLLSAIACGAGEVLQGCQAPSEYLEEDDVSLLALATQVHTRSHSKEPLPPEQASAPTPAEAARARPQPRKRAAAEAAPAQAPEDYDSEEVDDDPAARGQAAEEQPTAEEQLPLGSGEKLAAAPAAAWQALRRRPRHKRAPAAPEPAVLSMKELAMKFGDKVDEQGCHSVITVTRPEPEESEAAAQLQAGNELEDRTGTRFAVGLEDVAVAMISGRPEFFNTSHETVLRYLPRGLLIKAKGACPCSFRAAFRTLKAAHPDAKWYYVGDEDALIDLSQLRKLLSKYNSSAPVVVASDGSHRVCWSCGTCPAMETSTGSWNSRAFYGGNGQIFSAGLLQALDSSLGGVCMEATHRTLDGFGDLENTCNLARSWQPSFRVVQLAKSWEHADAFLEHPGDFITAHYLCAENIRRAPPVNGLLQPVRESLLLTPNGENNGCQGGSEGQ